MMKRLWMTLAIGCLSISVYGEMTAEDLLKAVDQMTPDQVYQFRAKLDARQWDPIPEGFFSRMAGDVVMSGSKLHNVDISSQPLSGGRLDVDKAAGAELGVFWRIYSPRLHIGVRFAGWGATDSQLDRTAGYSRADLQGGALILAANTQVVRTPRWLLWTEVGVGAASARLDTVNTPAGQPTTLRSYDASFGELDAQAGASWRFNPTLSLFLAGGYRFAETKKFQEGDEDTALELNARGPFVRFGLGANF